MKKKEGKQNNPSRTPFLIVSKYHLSRRERRSVSNDGRIQVAEVSGRSCARRMRRGSKVSPATGRGCAGGGGKSWPEGREAMETRRPSAALRQNRDWISALGFWASWACGRHHSFELEDQNTHNSLFIR